MGAGLEERQVTMDPTTDAITTNDRLITEYYHSLPHDITVTDALMTPWSGHRNIAMRRAIGMPWGNGEVCQVNAGGVIQVVAGRAAARRYAATLTRALPDTWDVTVTRRPDGACLVTACGAR
jgi:hypothetical protein